MLLWSIVHMEHAVCACPCYTADVEVEHTNITPVRNILEYNYRVWGWSTNPTTLFAQGYTVHVGLTQACPNQVVYEENFHLEHFCFIDNVSGASHGIVVIPPTRLAGVDCEPMLSQLWNWGNLLLPKLSLYTVYLLQTLVGSQDECPLHVMNVIKYPQTHTMTTYKLHDP